MSSLPDQQIQALIYAYMDIRAMSDARTNMSVEISELSEAAEETKRDLERAFPWLEEACEDV